MLPTQITVSVAVSIDFRSYAEELFDALHQRSKPVGYRAGSQKD
jgi:hypothetical protein